MSAVRAVTFDVGGTLIEPWPSVGHVYASVAREFGANDPMPDELNARFKRAWQARRDFDYTRAGWYELVRETFAERAADLPAEFFPAVYDRFTEPAVWRLFADVLPALHALRARGLKLGIISNWDDRLRPLLQRLELAPWFSSIVVSCELGVTKPDARLFHRAAIELGVAPDELLHVGDHPDCDAGGASSAGCHARLLQRGGAVGVSGALGALTELAHASPEN